eukprot:g6982.t1
MASSSSLRPAGLPSAKSVAKKRPQSATSALDQATLDMVLRSRGKTAAQLARAASLQNPSASFGYEDVAEAGASKAAKCQKGPAGQSFPKAAGNSIERSDRVAADSKHKEKNKMLPPRHVPPRTAASNQAIFHAAARNFRHLAAVPNKRHSLISDSPASWVTTGPTWVERQIPRRDGQLGFEMTYVQRQTKEVRLPSGLLHKAGSRPIPEQGHTWAAFLKSKHGEHLQGVHVQVQHPVAHDDANPIRGQSPKRGFMFQLLDNRSDEEVAAAHSIPVESIPFPEGVDLSHWAEIERENPGYLKIASEALLYSKDLYLDSPPNPSIKHEPPEPTPDSDPRCSRQLCASPYRTPDSISGELPSKFQFVDDGALRPWDGLSCHDFDRESEVLPLSPPKGGWPKNMCCKVEHVDAVNVSPVLPLNRTQTGHSVAELAASSGFSAENAELAATGDAEAEANSNEAVALDRGGRRGSVGSCSARQRLGEEVLSVPNAGEGSELRDAGAEQLQPDQEALLRSSENDLKVELRAGSADAGTSSSRRRHRAAEIALAYNEEREKEKESKWEELITVLDEYEAAKEESKKLGRKKVSTFEKDGPAKTLARLRKEFEAAKANVNVLRNRKNRLTNRILYLTSSEAWVTSWDPRVLADLEEELGPEPDVAASESAQTLEQSLAGGAAAAAVASDRADLGRAGRRDSVDSLDALFQEPEKDSGVMRIPEMGSYFDAFGNSVGDHYYMQEQEAELIPELMEAELRGPGANEMALHPVSAVAQNPKTEKKGSTKKHVDARKAKAKKSKGKKLKVDMDMEDDLLA